MSSVSARSHAHLDPQRSDSPLYQPNRAKSPAPNSNSLLTLDEPSAGNSALFNQGVGAQMSDQQLMIMEEGQTDNSYIQARGEAIDTIERTINELGSIFGQLATMVSEQSEMIQRIDANTEDVVDNVQGAQRELLKYWRRVSGNRWLIAKMFGVLMVMIILQSLVLPAPELLY